MLDIIEKVKGLFKCRSERKEESGPQQEEQEVEGNTEEQTGSFSGKEAD